MRFRIILLFTAFMAIATACNKESVSDKSSAADAFQKGQQVSIGVCSGISSTKVSGTDNGTTINFTWEAEDEIQVKVGEETAVFTLSSGAGTNNATFTGSMPAGGSTFDIQYPVEVPSLAEQTYEAGKVPSGKMSFSATDCTLSAVASLSAGFSVLQLNFTGSLAIKKIVVETIDASTEKEYTLNIDPEVTLTSTATAFYVATDKIDEKLKVTVYDNAETPEEICNFVSTNKINLNDGEHGCVNLSAKEVAKAGGGPVGSEIGDITKQEGTWD